MKTYYKPIKTYYKPIKNLMKTNENPAKTFNVQAVPYVSEHRLEAFV